MATPLNEVFSDISEVERTEADAKIVENVAESTDETTKEVIEAKADDVTGEGKAESTDEAKPQAATPAESDNDIVNAFKAKALDETRKRQELQAQLDELRKQPRPDAYVEPDKAIDYSVNQLKTDFENRFLNMSEFNARSRHGSDFDTMTDVFFNEMVTQNPALQQQAMQHPDPYEYIYQQAKTHSELKGVGSIDDLKSKIELEVRAKLEAEYAEKYKQQTEQAINNALPKTLATSTGAGGTRASTWQGQTPLSEVFK